LNVAGIDNEARFFVDNRQYPLGKGNLHIIEQAIETGVVGPEANFDRIIALSVVPHEQGSELGKKFGDSIRKTGLDFLERGRIRISIDLPGIVNIRSAGYRRIREGVDVGGAGSIGKGMQPVFFPIGTSYGLKNERCFHIRDINSN
jgi:hypothetical protein